jgi:hypothetical protein
VDDRCPLDDAELLACIVGMLYMYNCACRLVFEFCIIWLATGAPNLYDYGECLPLTSEKYVRTYVPDLNYISAGYRQILHASVLDRDTDCKGEVLKMIGRS